MDFDKIEHAVKEHIEAQFRAEKEPCGNPNATDNLKNREHALEVTLMCLKLYHEQLQVRQHDDNTHA